MAEFAMPEIKIANPAPKKYPPKYLPARILTPPMLKKLP
jgi:hypothetical protein